MRIKKILIFLVPILLILYFWKNTLLHLTTHLYDWHDVPFVIWVIQNNIKHIAVFDLIYHTETNAMFPFPLSLSFTDHMYFPSIIAYLFSLFTSNSILQFNLLAVLNHILLYISFYLLAGRFTKNFWTRVIIAFFISFSPYIFTQTGHFQMLFFWPLLLSLYFLFHPRRQAHHLIIAGLFLGWQFMSSIYIGYMGVAMVLLYYFLRFFLPKLFSEEHISKKDLIKHKSEFIYNFYTRWDERGIRDRLRTLSELLIVFVTFLIVCEPTLEAYLQMQSLYKPVIDQGQYVTYSAHITDYLFPSNQNSLFYHFMGWWRSFNMHSFGENAVFIGFIPLLLLYFWLFFALKKKGNRSLDSRLRGNDSTLSSSGLTRGSSLFIWLLLIICVSFIFSLGPRLNINGRYLVAPLPYMLVFKTIPFLGAMRALARWYLPLSIAIAVLLIPAIDLLHNTVKNPFIKKYFFILLFLGLMIEFYPAPQAASQKIWWTKSYDAVKNICKTDTSALLEYPFDYRAKEATVSRDLQYKTNILLASTEHSCDILSGFSGYVPPKYNEYRNFFQNNDFNRSSIKLMTDIGFKYVKLNLFAMNESEKKQILDFTKLKYVKKMYEDKDTIIIQLHPLSKAEMIEPIVQ